MHYQSFASESVSAGHPDKICDQISDAVVDQAIKLHNHSRVAVETLVTQDRVVMAGEVTCPHRIHYASLARQVIKDLGYTKSLYKFTHRSPISVYIHQQSPDIAAGVDDGGAGDQGMMFGYAVKETPEYLPLPIVLAHQLMKRLDQLKFTSRFASLRPDGKAQVVVDYRAGKPIDVPVVILAVPHSPQASKSRLKTNLRTHLINPLLDEYLPQRISKKYRFILNGTGKWTIGGPASDTGVTGRKIIVDTYGAMARHGGGCFSGKDPTKVDRSGAYACRYLAKNIVAAGLAHRCEVKVAYVIGQAKPVAQAIDTFGTATKKPSVIKSFADKLLDLSVPNILTTLNLRQPIYQQTAAYGHFGRDEFPWEKLAVS